MITFKSNNRNWVICEVPDGASDFDIAKAVSCNERWLLIQSIAVELESGFDYKIIGLTRDLTDEQCKEVMSEKDYGICSPEIKDGFITPKQSFQSLMESLNLDDKNPYGEVQLELPETYTDDKGATELVIEYRKAWQESENKIKNYLLIEKL